MLGRHPSVEQCRKRAPPPRRQRRSPFRLRPDPFTEAAQAILDGTAGDAHFRTALQLADREGLDAAAQALARATDFKGPSRDWWRCTLLLHTPLTAAEEERVRDELAAIEDAGGGPAFDVDRHALQVSAVVRYLEAHLGRVCAGVAGEEECRAIERVVRGVR